MAYFSPLSTFVLEETAQTHFEGMLCSRLCARIFACIAPEPPPCGGNSNETIFSTVLFPGKVKPQHKSKPWVYCSFRCFYVFHEPSYHAWCYPEEPLRCIWILLSSVFNVICIPFFPELEIGLGILDQLLLSRDKAFLRVVFKTR